MAVRAQRWPRLVSALEDLVGQETCALRARDFTAAAEVTDRLAPIVEALAAGAAEICDPVLRDRIMTTFQQRSRNSEGLAVALGSLRDELQAAGAARGRVAQIAPAYGVLAGGRAHKSRALNFVG